MARITVEDCLEKENNRFSLIHIASKRAKQLLAGSKAKIENPDNKPVVVALREIADGHVRLMSDADRERLEQARLSRVAEVEAKDSMDLGGGLFLSAEDVLAGASSGSLGTAAGLESLFSDAFLSGGDSNDDEDEEEKDVKGEDSL